MSIIPLEPENKNVKNLHQCLDDYFYFKDEVWGIHSITKKKKRIDCIIYPKQILLEQDFPPIPIGIEIKPKLFDDGHKKQIIELYNQAIDYRLTKFQLKTGYEFLPLILIYPSVSEILRSTDECDDFVKGFDYLATRLTGKFFIGEIELKGEGNNIYNQFQIIVCGNKYYQLSEKYGGRRLNQNWGFEVFEREKKILINANLPPKQYESEILKLVHMIGI